MTSLTLPYATSALESSLPGSDLKPAMDAHTASLDAYCRSVTKGRRRATFRTDLERTVAGRLAAVVAFVKRCILGWVFSMVFRDCGVGTPIDPHDLLRSMYYEMWTPVWVCGTSQPGYT